MSRVQLALNVLDVDAAVEFYSKLFDAAPAKRRPGYANFALSEPPLKLVLIKDAEARGSGVTGALNHLGVEVGRPQEVAAATQRLAGEGLETLTQDGTTCCYAVQDKVWVHDPNGAPWEIYAVLADVPEGVRFRTPPELDRDGEYAALAEADAFQGGRTPWIAGRAGSFRSRSTFSRTSRAVPNALAPGNWKIGSPTAGRPSGALDVS